MRETKVLLINPPWVLTKDSMDYFTIPIPIGLGYLAGYLESHGIKVKILDCLAEGFGKRLSYERDSLIRIGLEDGEISKYIEEYQPHVVGIGNFFTSQAQTLFSTARLVKKINPQVPVAVGGAHPSSDPQGCLLEDSIDFVIQGEGELTLLELVCSTASDKARLNEIKGLHFKQNGRIRYNGCREPISDLDRLPFPAYHLFPMDKYFAFLNDDVTMRASLPGKYMPLITSRGCPYSCNFCGVRLLMGRKWRPRSPKKVVDEMEFLTKNYGIKIFSIEDSNFTLDLERAEKICDEIIDRGLKIKWATPNGIRSDKISEALVIKMKNSGCVQLTIGIEHGNQKFLNDVIKKRLDLSNVIRTVKLIRRYNIPLDGFFIFGIPGETKSLAEETIKVATKLSRLGMMPIFNIAIPLPGTDLLRLCEKKGYLIKSNLTSIDYLLATHSRPLIKSDDFSPRDLIRWRRKAFFITLLNYILFNPMSVLKYPFFRSAFKDLSNVRKLKIRLRKIKTIISPS